MFSPAPDKAQKGPSRSRTWDNRTTQRPTGRRRLTGADQILQVFVGLPFGGESSADLLVKLRCSAVKITRPCPLAVHVLAFSNRYTVRGKSQQTPRSPHGVLLTDEEEVSQPVACFCIQRSGLECAAVVGLRLQATTTPARAGGISTCTGLCDALVDAGEDEVGENGRVGAPVEDCADNGPGEVACESVLEEDLDLKG